MSCLEPGCASANPSPASGVSSRSMRTASPSVAGVRVIVEGGSPARQAPAAPGEGEDSSPLLARWGRGLGQPGLGPDRLEELDGVARRVVNDDLLAADAGDDLVAEPDAASSQFLDRGSEVSDLDAEAVPASRLLHPAVGHWRAAPRRAVRAARPD